MSVLVLHAGDGHPYLTRQVVSGDHESRRGEALAAYYTAGGNPPGRWVGTGLAAMVAGGQVGQAQVKALFGEGPHPNAGAPYPRGAQARRGPGGRRGGSSVGPTIPDDRPVTRGVWREERTPERLGAGRGALAGADSACGFPSTR
jgi:hypothetical protein